MAGETIVAGLDLGSSRIKCVVAVLREGGQIDVIGTGSHPANGFQNGSICNADDAIDAIRGAVDEAEMMAGCEIGEVLVSVSGRHVESFNSTGMVRIVNGSVSEGDINAVVDMIEAVPMSTDRVVMHVVPQDFIIDGQAGIEQPLGMHGVRFEAEGHVILGHMQALAALEKCCRKAELSVADVVMAPLAQGEIILTPNSRELGVALVDIGSDTTELAIFHGGQLVHSALLGLGGDHVTLDIKDCLNVPIAEAEQLKRAQGGAIAEHVDPDDIVEVPGVGGRGPRSVQRALLCQIVQARLEEIFELILVELNQSGWAQHLTSGLVLTGGAANLRDVTELAEQVTGMPAVIGEPHGVDGLVDIVRNPAYATATGLTLFGLRGRTKAWFSHRDRPRRVGAMGRMLRWFGMTQHG